MIKIIDMALTDINEKVIKHLNLCLGFFDGIHIGHQAMINAAIKEGHYVGVMTFDCPPSYQLGFKFDKCSITSVDDKADILEEMGVKYLFVLPFDDKLKNISWLEFINNVLRPFEPNIIYCGTDYTFGKDAYGTPETLKKYFVTEPINLKHVDNKKVSSREIRGLLEEGNIRVANSLMGRNYRIGGLVTMGLQNGRKIGFPTANLKLDFPYIMPIDGVYVGYAILEEKRYKAMISIGNHPTISALSSPILEVHIIDYSGVLYGQFIFIELVDRIRNIMTFNNLDELSNQLQKDKDLTIKLLK